MKTILISILLLTKILLQAQVPNQALRVGDKVPEYELKNLINYPTNRAKISDFKGKLLILDFWSTNCASCVESWPKLIKLQREFDKRLQIILINPWQKEHIVRAAFNRRRKITRVDVTLPTVCEDSAILDLFPVSGVPHIVWVNEQGVVISITNGSYLNEKNIKKVLHSGEVSIPQKIGLNEFFLADNNKPLFINENGGKPKEIFWQSIFGKADERLYPGGKISSEKDIKNGKYYAVCRNMAIYDIYRIAYMNVNDRRHHDGIQPSRVILNVKDRNKYLSYIDGEPQPQNFYTYHLMAPPASRKRIQEIMRADLDRIIGLEVRWQRQIMKCLILSAEDTMRISFADADTTASFAYVDETDVFIQNSSVTDFLVNLEASAYARSIYPILDETKFRGKLRRIIISNINVTDYEQLNKAMRKYKMYFTLEEREVDVLVISEPDNYLFPFH